MEMFRDPLVLVLLSLVEPFVVSFDRLVKVNSGVFRRRKDWRVGRQAAKTPVLHSTIPQ
jgi:hypothetical protein